MMQGDAIYIGLTEIFRDVFERDDLALTPALTAQDVDGWDSFKHIEIMIAVEQRYRIKFHARDLDNLHSVGDLARVVAGKTAIR
jgi:acyl carrier protein